MKLKIFQDYQSLSSFTAERLIDQVRNKPDSLISLATGNTPVLTYQLLVEKARQLEVDFSRASFMGLDEWVGIPADNPGSCYHFLREKVFGPLGLSKANTFLFDSMAEDLSNACRQADDFIASKKRVDLMIVGIGLNGHIGFNEPGVDEQLLSHVAELHPTTTSTGQKYFEKQTSLKKGLTLGFGHILNASKVYMLANGVHKADIVSQIVSSKVSPEIPATILRKHPGAYLLIDSEASSKIEVEIAD